jgi:hypothetical protein
MRGPDRRVVLAGLLAAALVLAAVDTGGFTRTAVERRGGAAVVDAGDAAVEPARPAVVDTARVRLAVVENDLGVALRIENVTVAASDGLAVRALDAPRRVRSDDAGVVTAGLSCATNGTVTLRIDVRAVSVEREAAVALYDRTVSVDCTAASDGSTPGGRDGR